MNRPCCLLSAGLLLLSVSLSVPAVAQNSLSLEQMSYGGVTVEVLMPPQIERNKHVLKSPIGTVPARFWGSSNSSSSFAVANALIRYGEVLEEGYTLQSLSSTVRQQLMDNMVENMVADFPEDAMTSKKIEQQGYSGRLVTIAKGDTAIRIRLLLIREVMGLSYVAYSQGQKDLARRVLQSFRVVK